MKITTVLFGDLAFLPYQCTAPMAETIEFLTEIQEAYDGTEQRQQLRSIPRTTLNYTIPLDIWQMASAFNIGYNAVRLKWAVPIWAENPTVGDVLAAATSIAVDTTIFDFRANSLALLWSSATVWQIVEIGTVTTNSVTITNTLNYQAKCQLFPVRLGWVRDSIKQNTNGRNGSIEVVFELDDTLDLNVTTPTQYLSNDIYYDVPIKTSPLIAKTLSRRVDIVDMSLGVVARRSSWLNTKVGTPYGKLLLNYADIRAYRNMIYRAAGRFNQFWLPSFDMDLVCVSTGAITTTLIIKNDAFNDWTARTNITIQTTDNNWHNFVISNPTLVAGGNIQVTLDSSFNADAATIQRICYLGLYRLDNDSIDLNWIGNGIVQSEIQLLELTP